ncbi:thiol reductase thioredoxin [Bacillus lacus]|uniref:Thiol reductase thioredoxin n=1 Tax=Metabacillus lacus TaxID=1983721 RepID=A0A7X2LZS3_9BACI|nr:thioredoxin family protein [Metabacillus lacus]MRX72019.1 thiol reductase thioredoxin [Metabacillus lacus]
MKELTQPEIAAHMDDEVFFLYLFAPMCGTCQLAKKMLLVVEEMQKDTNLYSSNLNYLPNEAKQWEIESVPCLLIFHSGAIVKKIYAFHSIQHLSEIISQQTA